MSGEWSVVIKNSCGICWGRKYVIDDFRAGRSYFLIFVALTVYSACSLTYINKMETYLGQISTIHGLPLPVKPVLRIQYPNDP